MNHMTGNEEEFYEVNDLEQEQKPCEYTDDQINRIGIDAINCLGEDSFTHPRFFDFWDGINGPLLCKYYAAKNAQ